MVKYIGIFQKINKIGVSGTQSTDEEKKVRIVNQISVASTTVGLLATTTMLLGNFPIQGTIIVFILALLLANPLLLNYYNKTKASRLSFLILGYSTVSSLPIILGSETHFHYFLIAGIGMPLILLGNDFRISKWILTFITIPIWIYLEWHFLNFVPLIEVEQANVYWLRVVNDLLVCVIVLVLILIFTIQNNRHLKEIEEKRKELQIKNKELEQFAYIVSHDLKSPLININSLIKLVESEYVNRFDDKLKEIFSFIKNKSKRMSELVSAILSYSRAGNIQENTSKFDVLDLLQETLEEIKIPDNFTLNHPKKPIIITSSYIQLKQVLSNLISNAVKYSDKTNGVIDIHIDSNNSNLLKFAVSNNGPGIDKKYHQKIFEVFETANTTSRSDSTGVGLSIVKKLVEQHNGEIGLTSSLNSGSTFWFTWSI